MTNPLTMWSSCGIYTNLPYGYEPGYKGRLPDESSRAISNRKGVDGKFPDLVISKVDFRPGV